MSHSCFGISPAVLFAVGLVCFAVCLVCRGGGLSRDSCGMMPNGHRSGRRALDVNSQPSWIVENGSSGLAAWS